MALVSYQKAIQMRDAGYSEAEIADALGITAPELRGVFEAVREMKKTEEEYRKQAKALKAEGLSIPAIARVMGITDSFGVSAKQKVNNILNSEKQ